MSVFFSFKTLFKEKTLSMISIIEQDILNAGGSENETRSVFDVLQTLTLKRAKKRWASLSFFRGSIFHITLFPLVLYSRLLLFVLPSGARRP